MVVSNPYMDEFNSFKRNSSMFESFRTRPNMCAKYAWSIPDEDLGNKMVELGIVRLVEIGAGTGYSAYYYSQFGIDIVAYDIDPYKNHWCNNNWYPIGVGSYEKLADHHDRTLFLCWPPYDDQLAYNCLKNYSGEYLVYIGEGYGGCTADDAFHQLLETEWTEIYDDYALNWEGIHSHNYIYKRGKNEHRQSSGWN